MRILAVDPGQKRLGIAVSDATGTIANPLMVIHHVARPVDAAQIAQLASEQGAGLIIVGQAMNDDGQPSPEGRRAARLAEAIRQQTALPVELWDESGSTQAARHARLDLGASRRKRQGHLDELAATVILQSFLDTHTKL
jgi:putative holliday junction resolvase